jgi:hypothetical protein
MNNVLDSIKTSIDLDKFKNLLNHIQKVVSLEGQQDVKLIFNDTNIHIYTAVKSGTVFSSYKGIILKTEDYLHDQIDREFYWVIYKAQEFCKLFSNLSNNIINLKFNISTKSNYVTQVEASDGKIDMNYLGGDRLLLPDITANNINQLLTSQQKIIEVDLSEDLFKQIKSINKTKISREDKLKDVVSVDINSGKVVFSDLRWKIELGQSQSNDTQFFFKKKYLTSCISNQVAMSFYERFMHIQDDLYTIFAALELSDI